MKTFLFHWIKANRIMLFNTGSLVCTTLITSTLGFIYWWLATRLFSPEAVGMASASISAMTLLATISLLGLGSLLIGELPRQPGKERSLVSTAIILVGCLGGVSGIVFAILTPLISKDLQILKANSEDIAIFTVGVSLTAIALVFDQAVIGLLRSELQLWRNTLFALTKLVALLTAGFYLAQRSGLTLYATWAIGNVFSLVALFGFILLKDWRLPLQTFLPQWSLVRKFGRTAFQHHILNLSLIAPMLILPILVTIMLSARANAWFYVSFTLANFVSIVLYALTTVLYAMNAAQPAGLVRQIRLTLSLSLATSIVANCLLLLYARQILNLFGPAYAEHATWSVIVLGLGAFPLIIKDHYIAIFRIHNQMARAMIPIAIGCLLEVVGPVLGAHLGNLLGLSLGWVLAVAIEALYMASVVYRAATHSPQGKKLDELQPASAETSANSSRQDETKQDGTRSLKFV